MGNSGGVTRTLGKMTKCGSSPSAVPRLCDGASAGQRSPLGSHLIQRCLSIPKSEFLCTLLLGCGKLPQIQPLCSMTCLPCLCVPLPFSTFLESSFQKIPSLSWLNSGAKDFVHEIKGGVEGAHN